MKGRSWNALNETCYYPIDILQKPGVLTVARWVAGRREYARVTVMPYDYGVETIELSDIPQAHPSPEDLKIASRDKLLESKIWIRREGPARFTLPLGPPSKPFPRGKGFGVQRIYNGKADPQPHMGVDYPTPEGSPVIAVADGTVVLAQNSFFAGNAVFIDHGNGLVSMYFHLAKIDVMPGEKVEKGHALGTVDSTGRSTGPHLFFGVRWHNARIDPDFLFEDVAKIPEIQTRVSGRAAPRGE
jgi:murein DD-endopeptidase MepM/ murein hydrolase activator NlpD